MVQSLTGFDYFIPFFHSSTFFLPKPAAAMANPCTLWRTKGRNKQSLPLAALWGALCSWEGALQSCCPAWDLEEILPSPGPSTDTKPKKILLKPVRACVAHRDFHQWLEMFSCQRHGVPAICHPLGDTSEGAQE